MNNNVFVKLNNKKFNPDIESKLNFLSNERKETKFNLSKTIYNPITGVIPQKLNSQKDLYLDKDNSNIDVKSLVLEKENERKEQNELYKPLKTKIVNNTSNNLDILPTEKILQNNNVSNEAITIEIKNDYIKTYHELKNGKQIKDNFDTKDYDNLLSGLKDLGIINK